MNHRDGWRWRNVPAPKVHLVGLVLGVTLHSLHPWHVASNPHPLWIIGQSFIGAGLLLGGWAVRAAGAITIENPSQLVTTGPYGFTRNPMYIAWTALYVGIAFVGNTVWLFVFLPFVAVVTHLAVRREERSLGCAFGDDYRDYEDDVRRYI